MRNTRCPYERWKPAEDIMPEECGVFGVYDPEMNSVKEDVYYGLYALQHRGQESAGIAVSDGNEVRYHKDMGLVTEVFDENEQTLENLGPCNIAIGHVRYSTTGSSQMVNSQPLVVKYREGFLALAHNGNLVNSKELREKLEKEGHISQTELDTEVIAACIARHGGDLMKAIQDTMAKLKGSYALVLLTTNKLIGIRDPFGIRPLVLGRRDGAYFLSSESCALDSVGAELIRDIRPGEIIEIDETGLHSTQMEVPKDSRLCIFEFVYFARTDSVIDGISVYQARENAGRYLAKRYPVEADIVSGVPDSAITAAIGYAKESGIMYGECLAKNRYVGRTFIKPKQEQRERGVKIKLNALPKNVRGKRIVLIDDSIVRGTTSKKIVDMLRSAGAKEVHLRISSPPVRFPCYFGIDTPSSDQLIASLHSKEETRKILGADSLEYITEDDLRKSVEGSRCEFCLGCFNGEYPIPMNQ